MKNKNSLILVLTVAGVFLLMLFGSNNFLPFIVPFVFAHCDTEDGPVVKDAKKALETGNVNNVLVWVKKEDESEIKKAFEMTLAVRKLNIQARELSDKYFFETLVRIHRAGEGEAYTGLKPAGSEVEPGIVAADRAVETGSIDNLVKEISAKFTAHIHNHFKTLLGKKKHMDGSVEAGREFVEAYVTFIHYVERLYLAVAGDVMHHGEKELPEH